MDHIDKAIQETENARKIYHEVKNQQLTNIQTQPNEERATWDQYFMDLAYSVAKRSTCPRLSVGAVIVKDRHILSTGYNGAVSGATHCTDAGCYMVGGSCVRSVHAEQNAILMASKHGISLKGADIYVTHEPCYNCTKYIIQSGIKRVFYQNPYVNKETQPLKDSILSDVKLEMIEVKE